MNNPEILYSVKKLPIFQNKVFGTLSDGINSPVGDVCLQQNKLTGIVENILFDPSLMKYDKDYQNEQACSGVFQDHLQFVDQLIHPYFYGKKIVEVGCGKGYFLEYLIKQNYAVTGVDPAYEGNNPNIIKKKFDKTLGIRSDCIILRHVLEHISDPVEFLKSIAVSNGNNGSIYIEVPCFDWIVDNCAWFDIFYEHVNYFRKSNFEALFESIYEIGHSFGGQYLYIIADLSSLKEPDFQPKNDIIMPVNFKGNLQKTIDTINISKIKNKKVVVWGAASKGVIYTNFLKEKGIIVDMAIDINPVKQGKYMAGSGVYIASPDEAKELLSENDVILIPNSNYIEEIKIKTNNLYNYIAVDQK